MMVDCAAPRGIWHSSLRRRLLIATGVLIAVVTAFSGSTSLADPPNVWMSARKSAAPGEKVKLTVGGKGLAGDSRLWSTFTDPVPLAATPADNGKNDSSCVYEVSVPATAPLGIHALRVMSAGGVSMPLPFIIDDLPTVEKVVGNQTLAKAQEIKIPVAVDGHVGNLSRDYYRFHAAAGQVVSFEAYCRRLGSPMDASLYLYDTKGRILAYCDDAEGLSTDPQFVYTFAKEGDYVVELRDIRYSGGDVFSYHLRIGDFPCIHTAYPLAVKRGATTRVDFTGISSDDASPAIVNVPGDWKEDWYPVSGRRPGGLASAFATVAVVDGDEVVDHEPNNTPPQAQAIALGPGINGRFDAPGDVDHFTFSATKGQRFQFAGFTREIGAPSDLVFRMLNAEGKAIATADDNGAAEGVLDVTFPSDGAYLLEVTDLNKRGGSQYAYRIVPTAYRPGFSLAASTDTLNIPAGGTASLTISVARRDFAGPIELAITGLPAELTAGPVFLGAGINQVTTTISASKTAAPMSLGNVAVIGKATIQDASVVEQATLVTALRTRWSGVTQMAPRFAKNVSVSVAPAQGISLRVEPAEVVFGQNLKATVRVIAERSPGFDAPIKLTTSPEKDGLPANIGIELKPIEKDQTESVITLSANEKVGLGPYSIAITGAHEKDKVTTAAVAPNITFRIKESFQLAATPTAAPMLVRGNQLKFKISVTRNPAYTGDVKLTCEKLPAGVTAAETIVKADQSEAELVITAAADAAPIAAADVLLRASSPAEAKITSTTPLPAFSVQ